VESPDPVILPISRLPTSANIDFTETAFFQNSEEKYSLPTPSEVRLKATSSSSYDNPRTPPVLFKFDHQNIIVKYGRYPGVSIAEGQCFWAIKRYLPTVPVPDIYGWRTDQSTGEVFLYLEHIDGVTLKEKWKHMEKDVKEVFCEQLRYYMAELKRFRQEGDSFIGHIGRQPLLDIIFTSTESPQAGPFTSVKNFHDYYLSLVIRRFPNASDVLAPLRAQFPEDAAVAFSHNDLDESNILVSKSDPPSLVAIIDWHQAGWYPEYWEQCKARWGHSGCDWGEDYLSKLLTSQVASSEQVFNAFCTFNECLGVI